MPTSPPPTAADRPPSVDQLARSLADTGLPHPLLVDAARAAIEAGDPASARIEAERLEAANREAARIEEERLAAAKAEAAPEGVR